MTDGRRCAENCNGSTLKNAIVYFPPGTYLISKTIKIPFGTQVIGDRKLSPGRRPASPVSVPVLLSRPCPSLLRMYLTRAKANNKPTLLAAPRFIGLGVLSTDEYTGGGDGLDGLDQEYYINTANFYRQIRNLRIDITATRPVQEVSCIHYQVAQATSLQNLELVAKTGTSQRGMCKSKSASFFIVRCP